MEARNVFWLKCLRWAAIYVFVTGLLPILSVFESTQEPWRFFFDLLKWPLDGDPSGFTESDRQLSAILGGVLCGWAWLIYKLADPQIFNPKIRLFLIQSVIIWFLLDSVGSILAGLPLNAISNTTFLLILLLPLVRTHFWDKSR